MYDQNINPTPNSSKPSVKSNKLPVTVLSLISLFLSILVIIMIVFLLNDKEPEVPSLVVSDEVMEEMQDSAGEDMNEDGGDMTGEEDEKISFKESVIDTSSEILANININTQRNITKGFGVTYLHKGFPLKSSDNCLSVDELRENASRFDMEKNIIKEQLIPNNIAEQLSGNKDVLNKVLNFSQSGSLSSTCLFDNSLLAVVFLDGPGGMINIRSWDMDNLFNTKNYRVHQPFDRIYALNYDQIPGEITYTTGYGDAGNITWSVERLDLTSGASDLIEKCTGEPKNYEDFEAGRVLRCDREYIPQ